MHTYTLSAQAGNGEQNVIRKTGQKVHLQGTPEEEIQKINIRRPSEKSTRNCHVSQSSQGTCHSAILSSDGLLLAGLPKVRLLRNDQREGLIRSRVRGADASTGETIFFLDSHCEVNQGWVLPLLELIRQKPKAIVCPVIDVIDQDTLDYRATGTVLKGGFDWGLHFRWVPLTPEEKETRKDVTSPYRSPVIAGGLFLIWRKWWEQLGKYDPGLEIWGAENLEMSFKAWQCGGSVEVSPCSRIGHVFRKRHPYSFPDGNANTYL
ncbi:Polypeptide N-acetylgalactosaminyltransferase 14, partial [Halocaridina rubra]